MAPIFFKTSGNWSNRPVEFSTTHINLRAFTKYLSNFIQKVQEIGATRPIFRKTC